jgi:hypothetical protein
MAALTLTTYSDIDIIPLKAYIPITLSNEGRFSRASLEVGQGAAPADVPRKHGLGRSWVAVRAHYGALPLAAGRVRVKAGESRPDDGHDARTQYPEARPREQKSRDGAPKGVRAPKVAVAGNQRDAPLTTKLRLSALYPPHQRGPPEGQLARRRGTDGACARRPHS